MSAATATTTTKITAQTHPFYDKHDNVIQTIWSLDRSQNTEEKLKQLKNAFKPGAANVQYDIFHEKTGEPRAKVTPLILACFEGDYDTIIFLLDNGADPNQTESEHNLTPIHLLCDAQYRGQTLTDKQRGELLRAMVKLGADVNHMDKHQIAPIHKAVMHDRLDCVDALIEGNVDTNVMFMGDTPLSIAARQNREKLMKKLLEYKGTKADSHNEQGGTVLHFAAAGMIDSPDCVDLLIKHGLNVNIQDKKGNTPAMVACVFNKPRILQSLISNGHADLTLKNNEGKDCLQLSTDREVEECKTIVEKELAKRK